MMLSEKVRSTWSLSVRRGCVLGIFLFSSAAGKAGEFQLKMPIDCEIGRSCFIQNYVDADASSEAKDYMCGTLTYDKHNGTDFRVNSLAAQRAGVDIIAPADGRVLRTRDGTPDVSVREGGNESVRDRECGNGLVIAHAGDWETQYCHLAQGSLVVKPGQSVIAGQKLGRVGLSGSTEFPHLHFTVRHQGNVRDPFAHDAAVGSCGAGRPLWEPSLHAKLAYKQRTVLNSGFTTGAVTMESIEIGETVEPVPAEDPPAIVAFVRAIGLKVGDVQSLRVRNPAGEVIAENRAQPLQKSMAQNMLFAGKKKPSDRWPRGVYTASYAVEQKGQVVLEQRLRFELK